MQLKLALLKHHLMFIIVNQVIIFKVIPKYTFLICIYSGPKSFLYDCNNSKQINTTNRIPQ